MNDKSIWEALDILSAIKCRTDLAVKNSSTGEVRHGRIRFIVYCACALKQSSMNESTQSLFDFMREQSGKILDQLLAHIGLTFISLLIAVAIGVAVRNFYCQKKKICRACFGVYRCIANHSQHCIAWFYDSIAWHRPKACNRGFIFICVVTHCAKYFYRNNRVDAAVTDAAKGMGMSGWQILAKVELPLAMPVILAGIRTATVINVGVATLAAYIAAGGLGEFIFGGIALNNTNMILAGAIPAALLAILFDFILSKVQKLNLKEVKTSFLAFTAYHCCSYLLFICLPNLYGSKMLAGFTPEFMGGKMAILG